MSEPLTREEVESLPRLLIVDTYGRHDYETGARLIATVQAAEERAERLRGAIVTARQMMDDSLAATPGMAHHLRVSADRHLGRALAADDAARGEDDAVRGDQ